jgi:permuted papain-like amidase YaeF/Yiix C92 family enzyme
MADTLNKKQLENLPVTKYDFVRDQLMTGDIFFSSGSYRFSRIIQKLTKSVWSHVAIVYRDVELKRIMVLEAEPKIGIRLIPLSKYIKDYKGTKKPYKGQVVIAKLNFDLPHENMNNAISFGLDELSRPYDNWEIIRIFLRIIFRIGKREKNRNYICSELVRDAFSKAEIIFRRFDTYISPQEIWKDKRVEFKYRIL